MGNNGSSGDFFNHATVHKTRFYWQTTGQDGGLQHRPAVSRPYGSASGAGVARRTSAPPLALDTPRFHPHAKGKNVRLDAHLRRATRRSSFCNGVTFSQRPVRLYEKVRLLLTGVHTGWSGALRFGFTSLDPGDLPLADIPKYACPDLVTRPGYWAKALPERLAARDNVLAFWADRHGRVFYSINDGEAVLFHCGLGVACPLWAIIDIYGITQEVTLLESGFAESVGGSGCLSAVRLSAYLPQVSHDSANYSNNQLENNQAAAEAAAKFTNSNQLLPCCSAPSCPAPRAPRAPPAPPDPDLHFHPVRGADVILSADRTLACTHFLDSSRTLVFADRPLRAGETLYVEVGLLGLPCFGTLVFGLTSCDPATLSPAELPSDPELLLDRKEYWVLYRRLPVPAGGDVLSFSLRAGGEVRHGVNGGSRGRLLCVDPSQVLWSFFCLQGAVNRLRILGTLQASPPTSPSLSQGSGAEDSDSDQAFSVNRSSSASESSLVTAPSSPLSPPVSPSPPSSPPASGGRSECSVCFDQEVNTVIYSCGHMCLCHECGLKLKRQINACCPICRRPIRDVIKTYRP